MGKKGQFSTADLADSSGKKSGAYSSADLQIGSDPTPQAPPEKIGPYSHYRSLGGGHLQGSNDQNDWKDLTGDEGQFASQWMVKYDPETKAIQSKPLDLTPTGIGPRTENSATQYFQDLSSDVHHGTGSTIPGKILRAMGAKGTESGTTPAVASMIGGPLSGPVKVGEGLSIAPSHPVRGFNKIVSGVAETAALPLAATTPAFLPLAAPAVIAQQGIQKGAEGLGFDPENAEALANIGTIGLGKKFGPSLHKAATTPTAIRAAASPRTQAIQKLTTAVNPDAQDLGFVNAHGGGAGWKGNVNDIGDILFNQTKELRDNLSSNHGQALEQTAEVTRNAAKSRPVFKDMLNPSEPDIVPTTGFNGYRGANSGPNSATIGQLSDRLTAINGELHPAYQKGGAGSAAANAATNAERVQSLQGEAAGIRNTINQHLSKKYNVPFEDVAKLRGEYGKLMDVADTIQYRANKIQQSQATDANKPLSEKIPPNLSIPAMLAKPVLKGVDAVTGHPTVRGLRQAFQYEPPPPGQIPLIPPSSPKPPRTPFYKKGGGNTPIPPNASGSPVSASPQANLAPTPAIPASNPGLLRPGGGKATPSTPLPFGPTAASAPVGEVTGRTMAVGEEFPQISGTGNLPQVIQELLTGGAQKALPPPSFIPLQPPVGDIPINVPSSRSSPINPLAGRPTHTPGHLPGPVRFLGNDLSTLIGPEERISVIDPKTGNKGTVPRGQVDQALKEGFRLAQ